MKGSQKKSTLSLYRYYQPGDRVKRIYHGKNGGQKRYEGIIMAMDHDQVEVFWDTIDGVYCPDCIKEGFTLCTFDEVINGNQEFSSLKHKKSYLF